MDQMAPLYTRKPWDPTETPYRVVVVYATNDPKKHYWDARSTTFATYQEARAEFDRPFTARDIRAVLDVAENPESWIVDGRCTPRWRVLAKRAKTKRGAA